MRTVQLAATFDKGNGDILIQNFTTDLALAARIKNLQKEPSTRRIWVSEKNSYETKWRETFNWAQGD